MLQLGTVRPSASETMAIVLAVNWPAQAPMVGLQAISRSRRRLGLLHLAGLDRADAPHRRRDGDVPGPGSGRAAPSRHMMKTEGTLTRTMPIITPAGSCRSRRIRSGVIGVAMDDCLDCCRRISFARDERELHPLVIHADEPSGDPRWSLNSRGVPPAACTPCLASSTCEM